MSDEQEKPKTKEKPKRPKERLEDLETAVKDISSTLTALMDIVKNQVNSTPVRMLEPSTPVPPLAPAVNPPAGSVKPEGAAESMPIPPSWRTIVDELLGTDFGIKVSYPTGGSGFLFTLIIPKEKSNASKDHWEMFKADLRTKALSGNDGIDGVRKYVELVKRNLAQK